MIIFCLQMNTLSPEVMEEMKFILKEIELNTTVNSAVLISGKPNNFIAGADISVLQKFKTEQEAYEMVKNGHTILDSIEESKKPIIAAINGTCLGGGLEVNYFVYLTLHL